MPTPNRSQTVRFSVRKPFVCTLTWENATSKYGTVPKPFTASAPHKKPGRANNERPWWKTSESTLNEPAPSRVAGDCPPFSAVGSL